MKAASLFSGIGAPEVSMPGWEWIWHAEIEPFPCAVMDHHHPNSVNLGDVSAPDFVERALQIGRPNVLVFGSPCQDFSVAGQRLGMDGARGNLSLLGFDVARKLGVEWVAFENVPGLLSSYSGLPDEACSPVTGESIEGDEDSDFGALLSAIRECGYLGAYRIFDAQFAGVPQRRRRIFFVGRAGDWRGPAAVLFEPESLRGDSPPSRTPRERVAGTISASLARGSADEGERHTLVTTPLTHKPHGDNLSREGLLIPDVANPLTARMHKGVNTTMDEGQTMIPVLSTIEAIRPPAIAYAQELADPIIAGEAKTWSHSGNNPRGRNLIAFDTTQITHPENRSSPNDISPQLAEAAHAPAIAFSCKNYGNDAAEDQAPTLRGMESVDSNANAGAQVAIAFQTRVAAVRRLTPRECERLQGFPDDYTLVKYRGKLAADGPRYRALGNSMCVPEVMWILSRIEQFMKETV